MSTTTAEKNATKLLYAISGPGIFAECMESTNDTKRTVAAFMDASCNHEEFLLIYIQSGVIFAALEKIVESEIKRRKEKTRQGIVHLLTREDESLCSVKTREELESLKLKLIKDYEKRQLRSEQQRATMLAAEHIRKAHLRTLLQI